MLDEGLVKIIYGNYWKVLADKAIEEKQKHCERAIQQNFLKVSNSSDEARRESQCFIGSRYFGKHS